MFVLSDNAAPNVVLPEHFGPIIKNIYGNTAFLVSANTSLIDLPASIHLTFPNFSYKSTTGFESS
jgi:hypothetical protein